MARTEKKRPSATPGFLSGICVMLVIVAGCSSMDMARKEFADYCARQGKQPFTKEATQHGVPVLVDLGSTVIGTCYSDQDRVPLPTIGMDIIGLGDSKGVGVVSVFIGSIADFGTLRAGDIIEEFGGRKIGNPGALQVAADAIPSGQRVAVQIRRGKSDLTVNLQF